MISPAKHYLARCTLHVLTFLWCHPLHHCHDPLNRRRDGIGVVSLIRGLGVAWRAPAQFLVEVNDLQFVAAPLRFLFASRPPALVVLLIGPCIVRVFILLARCTLDKRTNVYDLGGGWLL